MSRVADSEGFLFKYFLSCCAATISESGTVSLSMNFGRSMVNNPLSGFWRHVSVSGYIGTFGDKPFSVRRSGDVPGIFRRHIIWERILACIYAVVRATVSKICTVSC